MVKKAFFFEQYFVDSPFSAPRLSAPPALRVAPFLRRCWLRLLSGALFRHEIGESLEYLRVFLFDCAFIYLQTTLKMKGTFIALAFGAFAALHAAGEEERTAPLAKGLGKKRPPTPEGESSLFIVFVLSLFMQLV